MNNDFYLFFLIALASVLIADISQIILKKAALKTYDKWYLSYLNGPVIFAYFLFFLSTICSMIALRKLPLSLSPMWQSMGQIFVALLSFFILKEKLTKKKIIGIAVIIIGLFIFSLSQIFAVS